MENNSYPVSIEIFAAYMDGNLSADEMQNIESLINNNNSLCKIKFVYEGIEPDQNTPIDDKYIATVESGDFKLPELKEEILDHSDDIETIDMEESDESESDYQNDDANLELEDEDSHEDDTDEDEDDNSSNDFGEDEVLNEDDLSEEF